MYHDGWRSEAPGRSAEAALRNGRFVKPRLKPWREAEADAGERSLTVQTPGLLETLHEEPFQVTEPLHGEVQIACHTHGLNFRDVLTAMGSYAGQASPMGGECAGVVVRAASGYRLHAGHAGARLCPFKPAHSGQRACGVRCGKACRDELRRGSDNSGCLSHCTLRLHAPRPASAWADGARAFGAGGLGQAAVQIATWLGVKVIATAGTEAKRAYLHGPGRSTRLRFAQRRVRRRGAARRRGGVAWMWC